MSTLIVMLTWTLQLVRETRCRQLSKFIDTTGRYCNCSPSPQVNLCGGQVRLEQFTSSDPSRQSLLWSQSHMLGIHCPLAHCHSAEGPQSPAPTAKFRLQQAELHFTHLTMLVQILNTLATCENFSPSCWNLQYFSSISNYLYVTLKLHIYQY